MPLEIILEVDAQKGMNRPAGDPRSKILFKVEIIWHGVPSERSNNQLINNNIFG